MRRNDSRIMLQIISDRRKENARDIRDMKLQKWHSSVFMKLQENKKYLDLSRFFIDERGTKPYYFDKEHPEIVKKGHENELRHSYHQAHLPVRQQDEAFGHAVRAVYLYSGMADIARITKDEELYQACVRLWNNVTKKKMYITGGIGATHLGEAFFFSV